MPDNDPGSTSDPKSVGVAKDTTLQSLATIVAQTEQTLGPLIDLGHGPLLQADGSHSGQDVTVLDLRPGTRLTLEERDIAAMHWRPGSGGQWVNPDQDRPMLRVRPTHDAGGIPAPVNETEENQVMTDDEIIDYVLKFEGGFTDNPNDRGGPTNFGITAADYGAFLGQPGPATAAQVRSMTRDQAIEIYRDRYIAHPGYAAIADGNLKLVVVDSGVLFGTGRATRWLQQALGVAADGAIGNQTTAALANVPDVAKLTHRVLGLRFRAIADIVAANASQLVFVRGWTNRAATLLEMV